MAKNTALIELHLLLSNWEMENILQLKDLLSMWKSYRIIEISICFKWGFTQFGPRILQIANLSSVIGGLIFSSRHLIIEVNAAVEFWWDFVAPLVHLYIQLNKHTAVVNTL